MTSVSNRKLHHLWSVLRNGDLTCFENAHKIRLICLYRTTTSRIRKTYWHRSVHQFAGQTINHRRRLQESYRLGHGGKSVLVASVGL